MGARERSRRVLAALASSFALLASAAVPAGAQSAFSASIGRAFQSAPAGDAGTQSTDASFNAERTFANRIRIFYDGRLGTSSLDGDWGYALHGGGVVFEPAVTAPTAPRLTAGASAWRRSNGTSWDAAGYVGLRTFMDVEWRPSETTSAHTAYAFDRRVFGDLSALDHREHTVAANVLTSVQRTRTTLVADATAGIKTYTIASGASGPAKQVTLLARVAQNVTALTGVSLQYARRFTFGTIPPILVLTPPLFFDDGVYDDPYASESRAWRVIATRVMGQVGSAELVVSRARKDYTDFPALDLDGAVIPDGRSRADTIRRTTITWTVPIPRDRTGRFDVDLNIGYGHTRHRSNDLFYNDSFHALGVGLTVSR